jgi:2-polyprenyl-3-methyl-5-hydroxy-6-metoxy-1,4-benzoquinol methylase
MYSRQARESNKNQAASGSDPQALLEAIRVYWNEHIHDLEIAQHPIGTLEFFAELAAYRFEKLAYLPQVVDFTAYKGERLLEVGCGLGIDLVRFARHGAVVTGIDLAEESIRLARQHFALNGLDAELRTMDGEHLQFHDAQFDVVYAHGVLQYTSDARRMVDEIHRVLKPGGEAILMVYNRYSWLNLLGYLFGVPLEHEDAPVLKKYSIREFRSLLRGFSRAQIIPERFPVKTRLHRGMKAVVYNTCFVGAFNLIPRAVVRPFGWHLMAKVIK